MTEEILNLARRVGEAFNVGLATARDGLISRIEYFTSYEQALAAAGLER